MSTIALDESIRFHEALMDAEFRGRGDNEAACRYRLSRKTGVPESYLYRLKYKRRDMRDVAGEVYRVLRHWYDATCESVEATADRIDASAEKIEETNAVRASAHQTRESIPSLGEGKERMTK